MQTEIKTNDFTRFSPFGLFCFSFNDDIYVVAATLAFDGQSLNLAVYIPTIPVGKVLVAYLHSVVIMKLIPGLLRRERMVFSRLLEMRWIRLLARLQVRVE